MQPQESLSVWGKLILVFCGVVILRALEGPSLLLVGQATASATKVFFAATSSAAVSPLVVLSFDVPYHECSEHCDSRKVKEEYSKASKQTERRQCRQCCCGTQQESDSIREGSDGHRRTCVHYSHPHSLFNRGSCICLINTGWNNKHVIHTNANQQERQQTMDSRWLPTTVECKACRRSVS